jgi:hypothetical protein
MIFILSALYLLATGAMRSHDLGPRGIAAIRKDQGLSQRFHVGSPFGFCPAPLAFPHHGDPTGLSNFVNSKRYFELADASLETRHAIIRSR